MKLLTGKELFFQNTLVLTISQIMNLNKHLGEYKTKDSKYLLTNFKFNKIIYKNIYETINVMFTIFSFFNLM